jgi:hypothetical protein
MTVLQFKTQVCEVLLQGWRGYDQHVRCGPVDISTHLPRQSWLNRPCILVESCVTSFAHQSCHFGRLSGKLRPKDVRWTHLDIRSSATAVR